MNVKYVREDSSIIEGKVFINKKHLFLSYYLLYEENERTVKNIVINLFKISSAVAYMGAFWEDSNTKRQVKFRMKITDRKINMVAGKLMIWLKIR